MALINIEYGSLASSETMNKNFMYLDDKIAETSENIMTSISSILSNIATINTRLGELSNNIDTSSNTLNVKLENYKTKTKKLVNEACMVPNWSGCISISLGSSYKSPSNGYILLMTTTRSAGNITINGKSVVYKKIDSTDDYGAQLVPIPVKKGDVISSNTDFVYTYFLPVSEITIADF